MATYYGDPKENLRAAELCKQWKGIHPVKESQENLDNISVSEFKEFISTLIKSKGGALPDFDDWKEIKQQLDRLVDLELEPEVEFEPLDQPEAFAWSIDWDNLSNTLSPLYDTAQHVPAEFQPIKGPTYDQAKVPSSMWWPAEDEFTFTSASPVKFEEAIKSNVNSALASPVGLTKHNLNHPGTSVVCNIS